MTCKEKLIADHPEWTMDKIDSEMSVRCPCEYGYLKDPDYCTGGSGYSFDNACERCWNREIPETVDTQEKLRNLIEHGATSCHDCIHAKVCFYKSKYRAILDDMSKSEIPGTPFVKSGTVQCTEYLCDLRDEE